MPKIVVVDFVKIYGNPYISFANYVTEQMRINSDSSKLLPGTVGGSEPIQFVLETNSSENQPFFDEATVLEQRIVTTQNLIKDWQFRQFETQAQVYFFRKTSGLDWSQNQIIERWRAALPEINIGPRRDQKTFLFVNVDRLAWQAIQTKYLELLNCFDHKLASWELVDGQDNTNFLQIHKSQIGEKLKTRFGLGESNEDKNMLQEITEKIKHFLDPKFEKFSEFKPLKFY